MQTGIVVSDLERSYKFYTEIIGMKKAGTFHADADVATEFGLTDRKAFDIIDLKLTDEPDSPEYKITKIEGMTGSVTNSFQPGQRYISIFVHDLRPHFERLKKNNIPLWNPNRINLTDTWGALIFRDPDGAMVEIQGPALK